MRFDAVVIGGGPGGATAGLLLAQAGWSVALVERKEFPRRKVCGEYLSATNRPLLARLGLAEAFDEQAGPVVRRVGLFAGASVLDADLPHADGWGRALSREQLDTLLLRHAAEAGVQVFQPWAATGLTDDGDAYRCRVEAKGGERVELRAPVLVAAHGSWETGLLPTQPRRRPPHPADLLAFKAHFGGSSLPEDLMPLLAFPGGYGGLVHCDGGRVSLSCCIRRDRLGQIRGDSATEAGEAVLAHLLDSCRGARLVLAGTKRDGPWLAAGPIRPGIRLGLRRGVFPVGNVAGEAHPVVAEGISMAMQSAWLLAERLIAWRAAGRRVETLSAVGDAYAQAWRRSFSPRLYTAAAVAHWAMRPGAVAGSLPLLRGFPRLLTWGARLSGKATRVVRAHRVWTNGVTG